MVPLGGLDVDEPVVLVSEPVVADPVVPRCGAGAWLWLRLGAAPLVLGCRVPLWLGCADWPGCVDWPAVPVLAGWFDLRSAR